MTKSSPSRLAKQRGATWEREVARLFQGVRLWAGPGIDVRAGETVIEAKSQQDWGGFTKLCSWMTQASGYTKTSDWILAVRMGLRNKKVTFAVMPIERAAELLLMERGLQDAAAGTLYDLPTTD